MQDNVRQSDLLDHTHRSLVPHDDNVINADGVRESQLQAGEHVAERGLGSKTGDHGDNAGRSKHRRQRLLSPGECKQDCGTPEDPDHDLQDAAQNLSLSLESARASVIGAVAHVRGVFDHPHGGGNDPCRCQECEDQQPVVEIFHPRGLIADIGASQRNSASGKRAPRHECPVRRRMDAALQGFK